MIIDHHNSWNEANARVQGLVNIDLSLSPYPPKTNATIYVIEQKLRFQHMTNKRIPASVTYFTQENIKRNNLLFVISIITFI